MAPSGRIRDNVIEQIVRRLDVRCIEQGASVWPLIRRDVVSDIHPGYCA